MGADGEGLQTSEQIADGTGGKDNDGVVLLYFMELCDGILGYPHSEGCVGVSEDIWVDIDPGVCK